MVSSGWIVLMAPAGVPDAVIQKVNADLRKVVAMPDVLEKFHTLGTSSRDLPLHSAIRLTADWQYHHF